MKMQHGFICVVVGQDCNILVQVRIEFSLDHTDILCVLCSELGFYNIFFQIATVSGTHCWF